MTAQRWNIGPGTPDGPVLAPVPDDVLAARWNRATWPEGNASPLALRLYAVIDELAGHVARVDMDDDEAETVRKLLDVDGLEYVIGAWICERVAKAART
jgi:hypothetical protein